jgi:hypothetical protein
VTTVPAGNAALHDAPQSIPGGSLRTAYPVVLTVSVLVPSSEPDSPKAAATSGPSSARNVHASGGELAQAPPQPLNTAPASGRGVNVSGIPSGTTCEKPPRMTAPPGSTSIAPGPVTLIKSEPCFRSKVGRTVALRSTETMHVAATPTHSPVQRTSEK